MSKVNSISSCPACQADLPEELVGVACPSCEFVVKSGLNEHFSGPAYVYLQHEEELGKLLSSEKAQDKLEKGTQLLMDNNFSWFEKCSDEDRLGAIEDAYRVIQTLLHSNASPEIVKKLSLRAQAIGDLGKSIGEHLKFGGYLHGKRIPKPAQSSSDESGEQAN